MSGSRREFLTRSLAAAALSGIPVPELQRRLRALGGYLPNASA